MLDFLLVLGQVPGTNFQITYNELTAAFLVVSAIYEYRLHRKAIRRWCKWAWYRIGVNYRRRKRQLRTYIKGRRYRLAVFERRIIRNIKTYFRRKQRAGERQVRRTRRLAIRLAWRSYKYFLGQTYGRYLRAVRLAKRQVRRGRQALAGLIYRRYSLIKRQYYIKLVQIERLERRAKHSRLFQSFISIRDFLTQSSA
jgi:hypothetical protein